MATLQERIAAWKAQGQTRKTMAAKLRQIEAQLAQFDGEYPVGSVNALRKENLEHAAADKRAMLEVWS